MSTTAELSQVDIVDVSILSKNLLYWAALVFLAGKITRPGSSL